MCESERVRNGKRVREILERDRYGYGWWRGVEKRDKSRKKRDDPFRKWSWASMVSSSLLQMEPSVAR